MTKTLSALTTMDRTLVFAKMASQEMEEIVLVNYIVELNVQLLIN